MTSRRIPRAGDKYRHFKGNIYQIITVAKDSETLAPMVVYQGLYGEFEVYVRPMADFLAELDKSVYPEAAQQYRFEPVEGAASAASPVAPAAGDSQSGFTTSSDITEWMMRFFDADDFNEKYAILKAMKNMEGLTDNIIDNMAATLDYVIDDGDIEDRFAQLMKCVGTRRRFESGRLR